MLWTAFLPLDGLPIADLLPGATVPDRAAHGVALTGAGPGWTGEVLAHEPVARWIAGTATYHLGADPCPIRRAFGRRFTV